MMGLKLKTLKNIIFAICPLLIISSISFAQNQTPVVENVMFSQRTNGSLLVDIYYDVHDADGDEVSIIIQVSDDAGSMYSLNASSLIGDIGENISVGSNKHIVWNFGADHSNYFSDQIQIKILADDGNGSSIICGEQLTYAGKTYNIVQIGEQCWLKENLDVGNMIISEDENDNQENNGSIDKYCFNNMVSNCEKYGGLYQWDEAMQYSSQEGSKGICPHGWHVPSLDDFKKLVSYTSNDRRKLIGEDENLENDIPSNETGFSALLIGHRSINGSFFAYSEFFHPMFWTSQLNMLGYATYMTLGTNGSINNKINFVSYFNSIGASVRCTKD